MGCCILGALIISRWLYGVKHIGLSLVSVRSSMTGLLCTSPGNRRPALLVACVAAEMTLFMTVAAHELNGHQHEKPSVAHQIGVVGTIDMNAICATTDGDR
jgi:hypothetical protein